MKTTLSLSEKIYKTMLELYPFRYKDEFGQEMIQLFQDMYHDAKNTDNDMEVINLWMRIIPDYFISLTKEHLSHLRGGDYYMHKKFDMLGLFFWVVAGIAVFPVVLFISVNLVGILGLGSTEDESVLLWLIFIPLLLISLIGSQWLVLRKYTDRAKDWLINTASAWVVMIASTFVIIGLLFRNLTITEPQSLMFIQAIQAIVYGGILGWFQKKALHGYANAWLLIPANIIGVALIFTSIGESISSTIDMMLVGSFPALFTGIALLFVLSKKPVHSSKQGVMA
ncbi:hypothetical protein A2334_02450 [Candidatus Roizmanbacteria bacterium RIFOXYB2_FULL_38_10]|uniref:Uncharacterized protein n=1 Tax=Candidatus Roizmanbacteria bacterium RIFOXYD1_FULL_38_12 TaxID=1802093 RepID=A0A1F7L075_9BACT|nr:MAG: hypothetical protein A3K47_01520 [Candidatus Roizmanbacteria bacterium RIFOXYA2_FULL_38_14]OGK63463.1 MAG: hypothetical protein A3K27_01520 [Candidatus Roizmanbacteria bacterium RIFOXYA1_FULL_37_12]OGK65309.1 MAG: hypothetical protein A3K38_01520 [Candidatus Roizmanbacteria bacterium RIFOXYB1_FULL_40_23]OGK67977.1 MAG: hypothetical protein A2334_02450 [Candidatus Roizmanbacteria bacterium RIFOXYB2_FULL_38_10]OGK69714.1 MAG: hypothetical protein A3K21_01525 [Candidatus Roizmanbacteria ba